MKNKPFEIGLSLTGSVSAGAYIAGVVDFILDALEEWEQAKNRNKNAHGDKHEEWDVPWHDVVITGLSGASGGGVTCGILLNTLGRNFTHVRNPVTGSQPPDNDLYNAWVNDLGIDELTDVSAPQAPPLKSLLSAKAIPNIADAILQKVRFGNQVKRPYVSPNLTASITVTNLRGIPYYLRTKGIGATQMIYNRHADFVKFELSSDNNPIKKGAIGIPYDTTTSQFAKGYGKLREACLATCAFPAAFPAQLVSQEDAMYKLRPNNGALAIIPSPSNYEFLCADGGILNTQPFELLHQDMLPEGEAYNPQGGASAKRAIIMVAPLDTNMDFNMAYDKTRNSLVDVIPDVIAAIRNEALYDAEDISLAINDNIYSRFIIAPVRYDAKDQIVTPAITGTSLNTFGAFLSRDFREHDYFLGRRNAQQFLKEHFAIPVSDIAKNPLFADLDILNNTDKFKNGGFIFSDTGTDYFTLIPVCGNAAVDLYNPSWPAGKYNTQTISDDLSRRTNAVIDILLSDVKLNFWLKIAKVFFLGNLKTKISEYLMDKVLKSLKENKL